MSATRDLIERLRQHYIPPTGRPGGVFVTECGLNNGFGNQSRCDALHVGFTSTSGRILRGHEVKVSRADWLHELGQLHKASVWADACHEWWLVTPSGIVRDGELPPGWGHMVPGSRGRRFKVIVAAERKPDPHAPSWEVMRSIMARLDTLLDNDRATMRDAVRAELQADYDRRLNAIRDQQSILMSSRDSARLNALTQVEEKLGFTLADYLGDNPVSPAHLADALKAVRARDELASQWGSGLRHSAADLRAHADRLDKLAQLVAP